LADAILFASLSVFLKGEQISENNWSTLSSPKVGCQLIGALYLPLSFSNPDHYAWLAGNLE
jgi:hypothetical protein